MLRVYILLAALLTASCGQKKKTAGGEVRTDSSDHSALIPEKPVGNISDFANLYSTKETRILDSMTAEHKRNTGNEVAVVTLNLDSTKVSTYGAFDSLSQELANSWGIGVKGKNNGVAIVIAPNLRMVRILVGHGLEEKLTDSESQAILDESMIPLFRNGEFYGATWTGLRSVLNEIK